MKRLTTRDNWEKHWSRKNLKRKIRNSFWFSDIFQKELKNENYKSFIEIGGYPGYFPIYFKKYWGYEVTLLDYITSVNQIKELLHYNNLNLSDINVVSSDFFSFKTIKKYDVVFSYGFIEHFSETERVLEKHWGLVKPGGKLIIVYPNFLGINGLLQVLFDPENLVVHNISIMLIKNLKDKLQLAGIHKYKIFYYGGLGVWLEGLDNRNPVLKAFIYVLAAFGKVLKIFGINNRLISPQIVLIAEK
jgi:SAM-dependent methyltransferase